MTSYNEELAQRASEASAALQRSYRTSRDEQAARRAALAAAERDARPASELIEDSSAAVIAAQYGIAPAEVVVNGHRYGDILAARQR